MVFAPLSATKQLVHVTHVELLESAGINCLFVHHKADFQTIGVRNHRDGEGQGWRQAAKSAHTVHLRAVEREGFAGLGHDAVAKRALVVVVAHVGLLEEGWQAQDQLEKEGISDGLQARFHL